MRSNISFALFATMWNNDPSLACSFYLSGLVMHNYSSRGYEERRPANVLLFSLFFPSELAAFDSPGKQALDVCSPLFFLFSSFRNGFLSTVGVFLF